MRRVSLVHGAPPIGLHMLWTREAVIRFASDVYAEYAGRRLTDTEQEQVARKARIIDFDATKTLRTSDPRIVIAADATRFYVREPRQDGTYSSERRSEPDQD